MTYRILLFGPQGSGKGTQGKMLSGKLRVPLISAGALWRAEIVAGTQLGKQAEIIIQSGNLAPDEWTAQLVQKRLAQRDAQSGFILDGYPRNHKQWELLDSFLAPTQVLTLTLSDKEAIKRLSGRLICPQCGSNYHVVYNPPKHEQGTGVWFCDEDEAVLVMRDDDKPGAVQQRLNIYHTETEPLLELYKSRGILYQVDAGQPIEKVHEDILRILQYGQTFS